jgi:hypothetical protein
MFYEGVSETTCACPSNYFQGRNTSSAFKTGNRGKLFDPIQNLPRYKTVQCYFALITRKLIPNLFTEETFPITADAFV